MVQGAPAEVEAGADIAFKVKVSCSSACDLRGKRVTITTGEAALVKETELSDFDGTVTETGELVVKAPATSGEYTWMAVFPAQENKGVSHEESTAPFSFVVKPHATSIAVWGVPSPIPFGDEFKIKAGVRCAAECKLTGTLVEIYDHQGAPVATSTLGDAPWPGTVALYCAEVGLKAPGAEGFYTWEVKFPKPDSGLPHEGASFTFGFATAKPPEHVVTVEVVEKDTTAPIKNADILLHPYRSSTDESGVARVSVPKGEYNVWVSKEDQYETFHTTVNVASDVAIKAELSVAPPDLETG
jgi:hypothetical protein